MTFRRAFRTTFAPLLAACSLMPAQAQSPASAPDIRNWLQVGVAASRWSITSGGAYLGEPTRAYSAEDDLGLRRNSPSLQLAYGRRIGERWRVLIDYERGVRRGSTVLARDLDSDYTRYVAGSTLSSRLNLETLQVVGGWAPISRSDLEVGLLVGGQWVKAQRQLAGTGRGLGAPPGSASGARSDSVSDGEGSPLLGAFTSVQFSPTVWLSARAVAARGGTWSARAQAHWQFNRHLALGLGYGGTQLSVDSQTCFIACTRAFIDGSVHGPTATLQLSF